MSHFLNSKDIGSITAYGDAITGGYEDSKETFYSFILNQGEFTLPINPSIKPDECTMYIDDVQGDREDVTIPTYASGKIVYDGESHTVVFDDVDTELMNVGGTFTATNAGTYYAEFTLKDTNTYQWTDGGIWKQRLPWTINKMAGVLTLSDSMVILNDETTTKTITFTASNTVTVEVQDTTLATATVSGNSIVVTMVSGAVGDTKLIVTCAESANQEGVVRELGVYANFTPVYGANWAGGSSSVWTRTDDSALFAEPVAYVNDGQTTPSSPFDNIMPWAGMVEVDDPVCGKLIAIPKYYYLWEKNGTAMSLKISPVPFEGSHVSPRHADCGDGQGERDIVYIGKYLCDSEYRSTTNTTVLCGKTRAEFRAGIHNLGSDIWQCDFSMYWTWRMLYLVEYANWNYVSTIGYTRPSNSTILLGTTDAIPYHTGTTAASRDTREVTKYRGIELHCYDESMDGITLNTYVYVTSNPTKFSDGTTGYERIGSCASKDEGHIQAYNAPPTISGYEWAIVPYNCNATYQTYVCAYWNYYRTRKYPAISNYNGRPTFSMYWQNDNYKTMGSRLMKLPNNT